MYNKIASGLLTDIASENNGYHIGEPWRFHELSLTAVIPLARDVKADRKYRLLSEMGNHVTIRDTGNINQIEVTNHSNYPILIQAGMYVVGATQSRSFAVSDVVLPGTKVLLPCVCVYSTKGIRQDQKVTVDGYAPDEVRAHFYRRPSMRDTRSPVNQQEVWNSVHNHTRDAEKNLADLQFIANTRLEQTNDPELHAFRNMKVRYATSQDDLAGRLSEHGDKLKEVLKRVPGMDGQVGLVTVSFEGAETMETFDHFQSWTAWKYRVLKAEAGKIANLSNRGGMFEFRADKAKEVIREMLNSRFIESPVLEHPHSATVNLDSQYFMGEVVLFEGDPIHCSLIKKGARN